MTAFSETSAAVARDPPEIPDWKRESAVRGSCRAIFRRLGTRSGSGFEEE